MTWSSDILSVRCSRGAHKPQHETNTGKQQTPVCRRKPCKRRKCLARPVLRRPRIVYDMDSFVPSGSRPSSDGVKALTRHYSGLNVGWTR